MLHADLCLALQAFDGGDEIIDGGLSVTVIPRCQDDHIAWLADRDGALSFGNINTNCIHETIPFIELQRPKPASLIAYSIYWVIHTNTRFNLRKTNAANEEPVG